MEEEKSTLVGRLNGQVYKGDIILLHSKKLNISGYILDFDSKTIKLSHEYPFYGGKAWDSRFRRTLGRGDKTYNLDHFKSYKILKKCPVIQEMD